MSRIVYVNGRYLAHGLAGVHVEDRGFQFGDGVYEVCEVRDGRLIDERRHMQRLDRSLRALDIARPIGTAALGTVIREVIRRNRVHDGMVYLQVTRGVAPRNFAFPSPAVPASLVVTAKSTSRDVGNRRAEEGVSVITVPENRWARVDIKTTGLLPNVLAKQKAKAAGAFEAWFVDRDGYVTEGASSNAWIVNGSGTLVTRPAEEGILRGVTRTVLFALAEREGAAVEERPFSLSEAYAAREAFITAATTLIMPVVRIDGRAVGSGHPGTFALALRSLFHGMAEVAPQWSTGHPPKSDK